MKLGHVTGNKQERRPQETPWYAAIEEERIRKVEQEWAEQDTQHGQQS